MKVPSVTPESTTAENVKPDAEGAPVQTTADGVIVQEGAQMPKNENPALEGVEPAEGVNAGEVLDPLNQDPALRDEINENNQTIQDEEGDSPINQEQYIQPKVTSSDLNDVKEIGDVQRRELKITDHERANEDVNNDPDQPWIKPITQVEGKGKDAKSVTIKTELIDTHGEGLTTDVSLPQPNLSDEERMALSQVGDSTGRPMEGATGDVGLVRDDSSQARDLMTKDRQLHRDGNGLTPPGPNESIQPTAGRNQLARAPLPIHQPIAGVGEDPVPASMKVEAHSTPATTPREVPGNDSITDAAGDVKRVPLYEERTAFSPSDFNVIPGINGVEIKATNRHTGEVFEGSVKDFNAMIADSGK